MAFDTTRSFFNDLRERPVLDGQVVAEEGQVLVYVDSGGGTLAVQPSTGAGGELVAGFAITDALKYVTRSVVEELVVPAAGGVVSLRNQNLVVGSSRAEDLTTPATLTLNNPGPPAAGEYSTADPAGTIEFNVAEAGNTVRVFYRYSPTLEEILATEHERSINNRAQDYFSSVSVGGLEGEIFTTMYDTAEAYNVGDVVLSGAGGLATTAAGGTALGVVSQVPSVADGLLGIKFSNLT